MRFRIWELIVLASLIVVSIIFSSINYLWSGFVYFTTVSVVLFVGFFINNRIYYLKKLKKEYDEELDTYFVELYNNGLITRDQLINRDQRIVAGYYKDFQRTKRVTILIVLGIVIAVVSIIFIVFNIW